MRLIRVIILIAFFFQLSLAQRVPWEFDDRFDPKSYKAMVFKLAAKALETDENKIREWSNKNKENWHLVKAFSDEEIRNSDQKISFGETTFPVVVGGTGIIIYSVYSENYAIILLSVLGLEIYGFYQLLTNMDNFTITRGESGISSEAFYKLKDAYYEIIRQPVKPKATIEDFTKQVVAKNTHDSTIPGFYDLASPYKEGFIRSILNLKYDEWDDAVDCTPRHPVLHEIRKSNTIKMQEILKADSSKKKLIDNWFREEEAFSISQIMSNHPKPVLLNIDYQQYKENAIWKTALGATVTALGLWWYNTPLDNEPEYVGQYQSRTPEKKKKLWAGLTTLAGLSYTFKHGFRIGGYEDLDKRQTQYKLAYQESFKNYQLDNLHKKPTPTCKDSIIQAKGVDLKYFFHRDSSAEGFQFTYMKRPIEKEDILGLQYYGFPLGAGERVLKSKTLYQYYLKARHARIVSPKSHNPLFWFGLLLPGYIDFMLLQDHQNEHYEEARDKQNLYEWHNYLSPIEIDATHLLDWEAIQ